MKMSDSPEKKKRKDSIVYVHRRLMEKRITGDL